jgi:ATP-binding cassette subfamily C protein
LDQQARRQFAVLTVMTLVAAMLEAVGVGLIFPFIKIISDPQWTLQWAWLPQVTSLVGDLGHDRLVLGMGIGLIVLLLVKNAYLLFFIRAQFTVAYGNVARYSINLLGVYLRAPYLMHLQRNSAELVRNVRELPQHLFNAIIAALGFITEVLVVLMIGSLLLAAEPVATALAGLILVGATTLFYSITGRLLRLWGSERLQRSGEAQLALQQALNGIKDSRILGCEDFFIERFGQHSVRMMQILRSIQTVSQVPRLSVELATVIGMIIVVLAMASRPGGSSDMLPKLALFAAAAFRLMPSVNRMTMAITEFKVSTAPLEMLSHDMLPPASMLAEDYVGKVRPRLEKSLELKGVSFSYPDAAEPAVAGIDLCIRRGDTIGLVGPSGSGKSTLVDIILGLLVPSMGNVLLDGCEVATGGGWHGAVGYVPQSIYITDDSVRRNVAFGIPDALIDDDAVRRALAQAHLRDFIESLPEGLDTRLAEDGIRLSGGQRQRIGIARALYRDPDLLVLDEATSALDPITEREISAAVEALHRSKTVIIIAHRLSTVRHCDRLLMIDQGRIIDSGTFEELHARNAGFQKLVEALALTGGDRRQNASEMPLPAADTSQGQLSR